MQNEPIHSLYDEEDSFRDQIATVDEKGKRKWIFPKMTKGAYTQARKYLAWVLIAILFIGPFLRYDGQPFHPLWHCFHAARFPSFRNGNDHFCFVHCPFYRYLGTIILWLDMPPNHFYGNGFSENRILDRRRWTSAKKIILRHLGL